MTKAKAPMWTLQQAVKLIADIQDDSRTYGYHVCLGGGVLNAGHSDKDVDIYLIPLDNSDVPVLVDEAVEWLEGLWGASAPISKEYPNAPASAYGRKIKFDFDGKRIDLFIMREAA